MGHGGGELGRPGGKFTSNCYERRKEDMGGGYEGEAGRCVRERNIIYQSLKGRKHSKLKNRSFAPVLHSNFD